MSTPRNLGVLSLALGLLTSCQVQTGGSCSVTDNGDGTVTISCDDGS